MNFLYKEYFYDNDMKKNELISISGNCFDQLCSIILNNTYNKPIDYFSVWLNNLTFNIKFTDNNDLVRSSIKCTMTNINKDILNMSTITITNNEFIAAEILENQLLKRGAVIFRTVDKMLPFSIYYDPDFSNMADFPEDGHVMLLIGMDDEYYYLVDQMSEVNMAYVQHPLGRKDIIKYKKKDMLTLFKFYCSLKLVDFNQENIENAYKTCPDIIRESINDYFNGAIKTLGHNSLNIVKGMEAIKWLTSYCTNSNNRLDSPVYRFPDNQKTTFCVVKEIINGITGIVNNKKLLLGFTKKYYSSCQELQYILNENIHDWDILKSVFIKNNEKRKHKLGKEYSLYFNKILASENALFEELNRRFNN